jgi:hypothetical protein
VGIEEPDGGFWGQLSENFQIVSVDNFRACAKEAMGGEVLPHELADWQSLKEAFSERIPKATLAELTGKIQVKQADSDFKAN